MNLRKMKIFYETATELNMSKAAKKMFISQPSVSQYIHEIEDEIGVKLFDRIGKKIFLTYEGAVYLNYCRRILNLHDEGLKVLHDIKNCEKGKIKIGASTTIGIYILPEIIKEFTKEHNEIEISLSVDNTYNIEKMILDNKIDFAYIEGKNIFEEIIAESIWDDELIFICSPLSKIAEKTIMTRDEFKNQKLIIREKGSGTREILQGFLDSNDIDYKVFMELGNTEAIKRSVEANLGIGCVSKRTVLENIKNNTINKFYLENMHINRKLSFICHRDKFLSKGMNKFIEFSKQFN